MGHKASLCWHGTTRKTQNASAIPVKGVEFLATKRKLTVMDVTDVAYGIVRERVDVYAVTCCTPRRQPTRFWRRLLSFRWRLEVLTFISFHFLP